MLGGEEGLGCEIRVDEVQLKQVSEFKYFGCVLGESDTDGAECRSKGVSGRNVGGAFRFLINARGLLLECARVLHEALLAPVLLYSREAMIRRGKERSRITAVQIDSLRGLLVIAECAD